MAQQHRSIFFVVLVKQLVEKLLIWSGIFTLKVDDLLDGLILVYVCNFVNDLLWVTQFGATEYVHVHIGEKLIFLVKDVLICVFRKVNFEVLVLTNVEFLGCLVYEEDKSRLLVNDNYSFLQVIE